MAFMGTALAGAAPGLTVGMPSGVGTRLVVGALAVKTV